MATEFMDMSGQKIEDWRAKFIMSADAVAQEGLTALANKKSVVVPGVLNKISGMALQCLPATISMALGEKATS